MSSSSSYEPDENEQDSESDDDSSSLRKQKTAIPASSTVIRELGLSSSPGLTEPNEDEDDAVKSLLPGSQTAQSRLRAIRRAGLTRRAVDVYLDLLHDQRDSTALISTIDDEDAYANRQLGAVIWSPEERNVFFNALARESLNGIQDIARAIGSKTELEVQDYIHQIRKTIELHHLHDRHLPPLITHDFPAAVEISDECCAILDRFAEYSLLKERGNDEASARRVHGDLWAVDAEKAEEIDAQISQKDTTPNTDSSIYLSASLLRIKMWIRLSERFFMNFGEDRIEDNWSNIAFRDESPSITADAFAEFYALAVSLTRRIIQSTLFFAESRIRNLPDQNVAKVRERDVRAALDVLDMRHDTYNFWVGLARRCSLDVADIRHLKGWRSDYLAYDEVEDILSERDRLSSAHERSVSSRRVAAISTENSEDDEGSENSEGIDEDESSNEQQNNDGEFFVSSQGEEDDSDLDQEDKRAELIDREAQHREELRIRNLLHCPLFAKLPPPVKPENRHDADTQIENMNEESTYPNERPLYDRKSQEDFVNWRDVTLHRSEWEEFGPRYRQIEDHFNARRPKRRRIGSSSHADAISLDDDLSSSEKDDDQIEESGYHEDAMEEGLEGEPDHHVIHKFSPKREPTRTLQRKQSPGIEPNTSDVGEYIEAENHEASEGDGDVEEDDTNDEEILAALIQESDRESEYVPSEASI